MLNPYKLEQSKRDTDCLLYTSTRLHCLSVLQCNSTNEFIRHEHSSLLNEEIIEHAVNCAEIPLKLVTQINQVEPFLPRDQITLNTSAIADKRPTFT